MHLSFVPAPTPPPDSDHSILPAMNYIYIYIPPQNLFRCCAYLKTTDILEQPAALVSSALDHLVQPTIHLAN